MVAAIDSYRLKQDTGQSTPRRSLQSDAGWVRAEEEQATEIERGAGSVVLIAIMTEQVISKCTGAWCSNISLRVIYLASSVCSRILDSNQDYGSDKVSQGQPSVR